MKKLFLSTSLLLLVSCANNQVPTDSEISTPPAVSGPTPNVGYNRAGMDEPSDPTAPDVAPLVPCKMGEIERRQGGRTVCISPERANPNSTLTGR